MIGLGKKQQIPTDKRKFDVVVFKKRQGGVAVEFDTATKETIDGKPYFRKTKAPKDIPLDATKYIMANDVLLLQEDKNGNLGPCKFNRNTGEIEGISINIQNAAVEKIKDRVKQWENPSWFQKWGMFVMTGVSLFFVAIFFYVVLPLLLPYAEIAPRAAAELTTAINSLENVLTAAGCFA